MSYFLHDDFIHSFINARRLAKLAAINTMADLVDKFDLAIKEVKTTKNVARFQYMLKRYFALLEKWVERHRAFAEQISITDFIREVVTKEEASESDLNFSPSFDVSSFGYTSANNLVLPSWPSTLEDAFSAIHQNLQALLGVFIMRAGGNEIPLPSLMLEGKSKLHLGSLVGVDLQRGNITLRFNDLIRQHGLQSSLTYQRGKNQVLLRIRYSGQNEIRRWDHVAHFIFYLKQFGKFLVRDITLSGYGVEFTIAFDAQDNLDVLDNLIGNINHATTSIASGGGADAISFENAVNVKNRESKDPTLEDFLLSFERELGFPSMSKKFSLQMLTKLIEKGATEYAQFALAKALELYLAPGESSKGHISSGKSESISLLEELFKRNFGRDLAFRKAVDALRSGSASAQVRGEEVINLLRGYFGDDLNTELKALADDKQIPEAILTRLSAGL